MPPVKKKKKTETSTTPPAASVSPASPAASAEPKVKYAGLLVRLGAIIVDNVLLAILLLLLLLPGWLLNLPFLNGLAFLLWILIKWFYFLLGDYKWGKTLGKHLFGLRVVNKDLATPLDIKTALVREVVGRGILDTITAGLGNLLILFDPCKQALHDKIAGTFVVHEKDSRITVRK